ncbi:MAG: PilZ domain-containing protein [Spirochaetales bacterium]|nr:PilZ domain-containing protein [Exilispira sp.]NMC67030.1 PilZ domain-containing protein [Spirochaetales bacterium]
MDRRKYTRRHLIFYLRIFDENDILLGYLLDISEGGILMMSETEIPEEKQLKLKLKLPKEINEGDTLHFTGIVKRISKDINESFYDIGIQIVEKDKKYSEILHKLVEFCGFFR